jgi:hypothetical protein
MDWNRLARVRADEPAVGMAGVPGERASTGDPAASHEAVLELPLTERILAAVPGPRTAWLFAWLLVPWLNLALVAAADAADYVPTGVGSAEVVNRVAVCFALLLSLWGVARIAEELRDLPEALEPAVEQGRPDVQRQFGAVDGTVVPLLITVAVGALLPVDEIARGEGTAALLQAVTWLVIGLPIATALWVYVALQVGLDRLGRGRLTLKDYNGDRTLGLKPVGRLAFTGFWMLIGSVGPLVLTGSEDLPAVVVGTAILVAGVGFFFLSLRRLHVQMQAIKTRQHDRALALYRQAYDRLREESTPEVLLEQADLLSAADALEKRAGTILVWPFAEGTFARVATIATSVAAVIIARLILAPAGL